MIERPGRGRELPRLVATPVADSTYATMPPSLRDHVDAAGTGRSAAGVASRAVEAAAAHSSAAAIVLLERGGDWIRVRSIGGGGWLWTVGLWPVQRFGRIFCARSNANAISSQI